MADRYAAVMLYSTRIPVAGWGSAALVGIAAAIVAALPEARALISVGLAGGAVLGAALIVGRASAQRRGRSDADVLHVVA